MSNNLVIVAIPEEQDRVWKISSEKVPHLTLLFLGEAENNPNVQQIMQFVQHATLLSEHGPFYLDVDRRGTLGDDEADVVFFSKRSWNLKWIKQFRSQLLQNPQIKTAYDSTEQFEEWLPHLTLGYPETPAKEIKDDGFDHPLYSVSFDRIGVWTGNYEGPDFRLEWPEREFEESYPMAMSSMDEARVAAGLETLEHFGVKGMKWGVRKEQVKSGLRKIGRGVNRVFEGLGEHFYETSIYSDATHEAIHNQVSTEIDQKIYRLQVAPKYRGKNLKTDHALKTEYEQDVAKVTHAAYKRAVRDQIGENAKGTKEARYVDDARGARIEIRDKKSGAIVRESDLRSVQEIQADRLDTSVGGAGGGTSQYGRRARHAADDVQAPDITIPLKLDSRGFISSVGKVKSEAEHSALHDEELMARGAEFIEHYGVKGMKWGVRRAGRPSGLFSPRRGEPVPVAPTTKVKVPHGRKRKTKIKTDGGENQPAADDALKVAESKAKLKKSGPNALTNQELRDVAQRIRLENEVRILTSNKGKRWVTNQFENETEQLVRRGVKKGVKKGGKAVVKKAAITALI